jgi:hypothetical protein
MPLACPFCGEPLPTEYWRLFAEHIRCQRQAKPLPEPANPAVPEPAPEPVPEPESAPEPTPDDRPPGRAMDWRKSRSGKWYHVSSWRGTTLR